MQERAERPGGRCELDIGVGEHDQRRVSAELERDALQGAPGRLADGAPGRGRAGEGDHVHILVRGQGLAGLGAARETCEDPVGQPGLLEDAREQDAADDRCLGIGLQDDRVPERQGRRTDRIDRITGKFHGVITATTPTGKRRGDALPAGKRRWERRLEGLLQQRSGRPRDGRSTAGSRSPLSAASSRTRG